MLQSKKVQERNPPKMTQIIIKNHKNRNFFFHSIKKNSTGPGAASYEYIFYSFFSVNRELIDHFGEEIVWLPFFSQIGLLGA